MSYSYEIYAHLKSIVQTLEIDQVMTVADVTDRARRIGWSCCDMYSLVRKGNEEPVLRQFFRALDRETGDDIRDMNVVASNIVERWLTAPPPSPSVMVIRELVTALGSEENRSELLHILTEEECLSPVTRHGFTITPFFDEDTIEWAGYTIHVYSNGERYQLDHNPGNFDDVDLLIQVLKQVVPGDAPQLQGKEPFNPGECESIDDIAADLRDRLELWQLINIKNSLTNGPKEFFWSGDGVPVELRKVQALQWELRVGGYSHDRVTWILDGREVCQLAGAIGKYF